MARFAVCPWSDTAPTNVNAARPMVSVRIISSD
jgi:hypothetical protein